MAALPPAQDDKNGPLEGCARDHRHPETEGNASGSGASEALRPLIESRTMRVDFGKPQPANLCQFGPFPCRR